MLASKCILKITSLPKLKNIIVVPLQCKNFVGSFIRNYLTPGFVVSWFCIEKNP